MRLLSIISETFKKLVNESAEADLINQAIDGAYRASFSYPDSKTNEMIRRNVFIYSYGRSTTGKELIRCYQLDGSGSGSKWKLFDVSKIQGITLNKRMKVRALWDNVPSYRTDGDKAYAQTYNMLDPEKITGISSNKSPQQLVSKEPNSVDNGNEDRINNASVDTPNKITNKSM